MTPPYAHLPEPVVNAMPKLSDKAVRVAVALGVFMDGAGECFPSRDQIRQRCGLACLYSVSLGVQELKAAGVLEVRRRRNSSSIYQWAEGRPNRLSGRSAKPTFRKNKGISRKVGDTDQSVKPTAGKSVSPTPNIPTEHPHQRPASPQAAQRGRKPKGASTEKRGPDVVKWWIAANVEAGRDAPVVDGALAGAAKNLGKLVTSGQTTPEELRSCMASYLSDESRFLVDNGHALRFLNGGRIDAYRNRAREEDPPPLDADLVNEIEARAEKGQR